MALRPSHLLAAIAVFLVAVPKTPAASDNPNSPPAGTLQKYCFTCHANGQAMGGIKLDALLNDLSVGRDFKQWQKVANALDEHRMPPKAMPQPPDNERAHAIEWIRSEMTAFTNRHGGEPGKVTVRRLTSGEYAYAIHDLTGLDIDTGIDAATDSVGGEGFTNFGDVQFMQDSNLERYLAAAKKVADHAVIGAGPLAFYHDPGATGYEYSAISRIKEIYEQHGFRTVSGEGGFPYGLERYGKAFFVAWQVQRGKGTFESLSAKEGVDQRFARHLLTVMSSKSLGYPASEAAARFKKITPAMSEKDARAACDDLQKFVTTWPLWLFARGDQAVGGAGDESPLIINEASLKVAPKHHFVFNRIARRPLGATVEESLTNPTKVYLNVETVTPSASGKPVLIWRNATVAYRTTAVEPDPPAVAGEVAPAPKGIKFGPKQSLKSVVSEETAAHLAFGRSLDGSQVGPGDFAAELGTSFDIPVPSGATGFQFQADVEVGAGREHVYRIVITDRADGSSRGIPVRKLIGDPQSAGYHNFKEGVLQFAKLLPPNSQIEPTPADKDPIPLPFDSTYNVPEHDDFDTRVKYLRGDRYIYENILDDATRAKLDQAYFDLYASFNYHDNYLDILAKHYGSDLHGKHVWDITEADLAALPEEPRKYMLPIKAEYDSVIKAQAAAQPKRLDDCLEFASQAWRRPLTADEKKSLRAFYAARLADEKDHRKAIRAVITRILVSPAFLYRLEQTADSTAAVKPVTQWETASRLSFFLWSSIPDAELRRAASANELSNPDQLKRQVKRMLADEKARRMSTEFFGQWLGFYRFDQFRGVDTGRFPEFKDEIRTAMYDEAVSFFEYIVRNDRPALEILDGDYTFLNKPLAQFYGVKRDVASTDRAVKIDGAREFERGGLLRLGAILTATSAPLRTSPVKRGDWVLRRLLGTATPPPPADAGSIPADDKMFGGMTLREKLESHKRNATCASCHMRIDPLGFPLEAYDSTGRFRAKYADGKPIWDKGTLADKTEIDGVQGLLDYLKQNNAQVRRTMSAKLLGYAFGRAVQASDQPLIDKMVAAGPSVPFSDLVADVVLSRQFRNRAGREDTAIAFNDKVGAK